MCVLCTIHITHIHSAQTVDACCCCRRWWLPLLSAFWVCVCCALVAFNPWLWGIWPLHAFSPSFAYMHEARYRRASISVVLFIFFFFFFFFALSTWLFSLRNMAICRCCFSLHRFGTWLASSMCSCCVAVWLCRCIGFRAAAIGWLHICMCAWLRSYARIARSRSVRLLHGCMLVCAQHISQSMRRDILHCLIVVAAFFYLLHLCHFIRSRILYFIDTRDCVHWRRRNRRKEHSKRQGKLRVLILFHFFSCCLFCTLLLLSSACQGWVEYVMIIAYVTCLIFLFSFLLRFAFNPGKLLYSTCLADLIFYCSITNRVLHADKNQ